MTHFQNRAKERFNMDVTLEEMQAVIEKIKAGRLEKVKLTKQPESRSGYLAVLHQELVLVIYDEVTEHLITCMRPFGKMKKDYFKKYS